MRLLRWLFACALLTCVSGCDASNALGIDIDLTKLNWQTGALLVLLYLSRSDKHLAGLANTLKQLGQSLRVLPADRTPEALTAEQLAVILADLIGKLKGNPALQAELVALQAKALTQQEAAGNAGTK